MLERRFSRGECEIRAASNGKPMIAGYAAVFNKRSHNLGGFVEQIHPGSFNRTLQTADVRALGNHDPNWLLGRSTSASLRLGTDTNGLQYEIDVNMQDPDGQRALAKVERGDWDGSSFSFRTLEDAWEFAEDPVLRTLKDVELIDVGPVTFPAYPDATTMSRGAVQLLAETRQLDPVVVAEALVSGEIRSLITDGIVEEAEPEPEEPAKRNDGELELFREQIWLIGQRFGLPDEVEERAPAVVDVASAQQQLLDQMNLLGQQYIAACGPDDEDDCLQMQEVLESLNTLSASEALEGE